MNGWLIGVGVWVLSDGVYSWSLYTNASTYGSNVKQTFLRDHWVRLVRIICGIGLVIMGAIYE